MDPGRRAVETREVAYVRVGERLVDPHGVQHEVLAVALRAGGDVELRLGRLHGEHVTAESTQVHRADDLVRVRVRIGPST